MRTFRLSEQRSRVPKRLRLARRWQWFAAFGSVLFFLACLIGWPLGYLWPSAIGFVAFLPGCWVFNTKCYDCGYPAFASYAADEKLRGDKRFWTRFWGKEYGGVNLPLRRACSKCGARF